MNKICTKCSLLKSLVEFNKRASSKDGRQSQCKICNKTNLKKHYGCNKDYYIERNKQRRKELREFIISLKLSCLICKEKEHCCLEFHHVDSDTKDFVLAEAANRMISKEKILEEIEKCVVVCSNCHKKIHYGILDLSRFES
jgi:hypothetical protein